MVSSLSSRERALGAYFGLAIGDALGATTEFLTPREIVQQYGRHQSIIGGGWLRLKAGEVTDDTQMSLALGDAIIQERGVKAGAVASAFSDWMRSKPVDIGHTVRRGIVRYRSSGTTAVPFSEHDAGNGSCMRALPVALAYSRASTQQLCDANRTQSHVTHHNPHADAGTETVLQMVIAAMNGDKIEALQRQAAQLVADYPVFEFGRKRVENPSGWIVQTLQVVFQALFGEESFEAVLVDVVNRGGDADTTGAIAGMVAGAFYGPQAIPERWLEAMNPKILSRCQSQTEALLDLAEAGVEGPSPALGLDGGTDHQLIRPDRYR
ncbi:MAG: ADP-ribosyl-[dinitrogen reductase] hydrolase [Gammaproteobacteria bacterium]|nr:ADP-ribosyl-[dinitrogen reductase] hydrolase [Gammaproteobacteria bacterium]